MILDASGRELRRAIGFRAESQFARDEKNSSAQSSTLVTGKHDTEWQGGGGLFRRDAYGRQP